MYIYFSRSSFGETIFKESIYQNKTKINSLLDFGNPVFVRSMVKSFLTDNKCTKQTLKSTWKSQILFFFKIFLS